MLRYWKIKTSKDDTLHSFNTILPDIESIGEIAAEHFFYSCRGRTPEWPIIFSIYDDKKKLIKDVKVNKKIEIYFVGSI